MNRSSHRFAGPLAGPVAGAVVGLFVAFSASPASAFGQYRAEIPNGAANSCLTCHQGAGGGRPWNDFGDLLFTTNGGTADTASTVNAGSADFIWWNAAICGADSDGDGQTNGEELGDPDCVWTSGAAARTTDISLPGNVDSVSADPTGGGTGGGDEGEGEGEGGGGGEGEGEGGGDGGCFGSAQAAALLPALLLLRRRRQR